MISPEQKNILQELSTLLITSTDSSSVDLPDSTKRLPITRDDLFHGITTTSQTSRPHVQEIVDNYIRSPYLQISVLLRRSLIQSDRSVVLSPHSTPLISHVCVDVFRFLKETIISRPSSVT